MHFCVMFNLPVFLRYDIYAESKSILLRIFLFLCRVFFHFFKVTFVIAVQTFQVAWTIHHQLTGIVHERNSITWKPVWSSVECSSQILSFRKFWSEMVLKDFGRIEHFPLNIEHFSILTVTGSLDLIFETFL